MDGLLTDVVSVDVGDHELLQIHDKLIRGLQQLHDSFFQLLLAFEPDDVQTAERAIEFWNEVGELNSEYNSELFRFCNEVGEKAPLRTWTCI